MLMLQKITLATSVAAFAPSFVFAEETPAAADVDASLDDLDKDDSLGGLDGMPEGMPEGMDMEKMMEALKGLDPETLASLKNMPGMEGLNLDDIMGSLGGEGGAAGGAGGMPGGPPAPPKPTLAEFEDEAELKKTMEERTAANALYVFECASGEAGDACAETAKALGGEQGLYAKVGMLREDEGATENKLAVYKGTGEEAVFAGDIADADAAKAWAKENRVPAFGQIDDSNFEIYFEAAKKGIFWACFNPETMMESVKEYAPAFVAANNARAADDKVEDKFPFVWLDVQKFGDHAEKELGCKKFPTIVLQRGDLMGETQEAIDSVEKFVRHYDSAADLTEANVLKFFTDIDSGDLKAEEKPDPLDALDDDDEEDAAAAKAAPAEEVASKDDAEKEEKAVEEKEEL